MKASFYIACWFMTLFVGAIFASVIGSDVYLGFLFSVVAGFCSAPFIILFSIAMHYYIRKNPSKKELHLRTLIVHIVGSCLTVAVLIFMLGEFPGELFLAIVGYFLIDSLFFHAFIQAKYEENQSVPFSENEDILDSPI